MKNGLLCFSVILLISGCQSIQKTLYGIKQPRVENLQTVSAYLKRHKTDTTKSVCFKDFHSFIAASKHKMLVIPDAMFFNKDGAFVPYRNSAEACNAKVDVFLKDLARFNEKPFESHKNLELFSKWINDPSKITKSDVTVIITWTDTPDA